MKLATPHRIHLSQYCFVVIASPHFPQLLGELPVDRFQVRVVLDQLAALVGESVHLLVDFIQIALDVVPELVV